MIAHSQGTCQGLVSAGLCGSIRAGWCHPWAHPTSASSGLGQSILKEQVPALGHACLRVYAVDVKSFKSRILIRDRNASRLHTELLRSRRPPASTLLRETGFCWHCLVNKQKNISLVPGSICCLLILIETTLQSPNNDVPLDHTAAALLPSLTSFAL